MSLVLIISIVIRLLAMGWSIVLLCRMKDWRMGCLTMMLALMALRQTLTLLMGKESWAIFVAGPTSEFPGLLVSIMAFLAVFFLERIVAERKQAEQAIQESEERYRTLTDDVLDSSAVGIFILDADFKVVWVNQSLERFFGIHRGDIIRKDKRELIRREIKGIFADPEDFAARVLATYDDNTYVENFECHVLPAGGREERWLEHRSQPIGSGLYAGGRIEHYYDITERKQAEAHIQHLQSVLMAIRDVNQLIVHEKNQQKLLQVACEIITQTRDYKLVWIGAIQKGDHTVLPVAQAGFEEGYLKTIQITWDDSVTGKGPTGTAIRTRKPSIMRDIAGDPRYKPWREGAMERGYTSSAAIPLVYENRVFGALNVYTALSNAFDEEEIALLVEVGQDIAFALHNIEIEEERRRAEAQLHKSESRLAAILDIAADAIISVNEDQRITLFNQAAEKIFGYREKEVLGKPHDILLPEHLVARHRQLIDDFNGVTSSTRQMGTSRPDIFAKRKDGSMFPVDAGISRLVFGEEITYTVILRDITEIQKTEALQLGRNMVLERLALGAPLVEVLSSLVDISEKNNPGMLCSVLLLDKEKKHLLYGAAASLPDFYNEAINGLKIGSGVGSCGTAAYTGKRVIVEDIMTHPYWIAFRGIAKKVGLRACWSEPIFSSTGQVLGTFALYYREPRAPDSSDLEFIKSTAHLAGIAIEKKQTEEALQQAYDGLENKVAERTRELVQANIQLKDVDRLKSEFLATMSHELRTPLNSIIGFVGIILQGIAGEINEEQKKQLSMVYGSAKHLLSLINDILDLSRVESGKMEIAVTRFKIEEVISEVTQTLSPMVSQKGLQLITEMPDETPEIYNDRKKVLQILLNLVNNAVKFTNKGEVRIDCTIDDHNLELSVSDTGIGIKREKMNHLFEAFRQVDGTAQRRYQGTGLGLYLCRKLATLLDGKVWAESLYGKGSRFTFTLPLRPRERSIK
jgi:PAS domain S-box-containing protein